LFSVCACAILRLMVALVNTASGRWYMIPVIALAVGLICASGCGPRYPAGSIDDLFVTNKRYNIDNNFSIVVTSHSRGHRVEIVAKEVEK